MTNELDLETIAEVANDNNLPPSDAVSTVNGVDDEEENEQVEMNIPEDFLPKVCFTDLVHDSEMIIFLKSILTFYGKHYF